MIKPLLDVLPAFGFVAVLGWADAHPTQAAAWAGANVDASLPLLQVGVREAPVLLATVAALAVLLAHAGWRRLQARPAHGASARAMLALVALLAAAAIVLAGDAPSRWKPSVLYWGLGLTFWLVRVGLGGNLLRTLIGHRGDLSDLAWQRLNAAWVGFFGMLGLIHLGAAYHLPDGAWLQFKVFGGLALVLPLVVAQAAYMNRHAGRPLRVPAPGPARP